MRWEPRDPAGGENGLPVPTGAATKRRSPVPHRSGGVRINTRCMQTVALSARLAP
ncbi:hypothetical protein GCM10020227_39620 [Streptomyces flavovirens]